MTRWVYMLSKWREMLSVPPQSRIEVAHWNHGVFERLHGIWARLRIPLHVMSENG